MKRIITCDDIIDLYQKVIQRGAGFILSKFNFNRLERTKSAFDDSAFNTANWWIVPEVRRRWNKMITGDENQIYEDYLIEKHLKYRSDLEMLSIGSGICSHEIELAKDGRFKNILCVDVANNMLDRARVNADRAGLDNISFRCEDIKKARYDSDSFDIIFFHASLHHFDHIDHLISESIIPWLRSDGLLVINEYVGPDRLQFPKEQINAINKSLALLPSHLKVRYKTKLYKNRFYGSGYLRMVLADPSECIDSASILPTLRKRMEVLDEKPYGGNLLMNVLKDIAHNFVEDTDSTKHYLEKLFIAEDEFLEENESDFIFAVYQKR